MASRARTAAPAAAAVMRDGERLGELRVAVVLVKEKVGPASAINHGSGFVETHARPDSNRAVRPNVRVYANDARVRVRHVRRRERAVIREKVEGALVPARRASARRREHRGELAQRSGARARRAE